jgi:hypothetical protein
MATEINFGTSNGSRLWRTKFTFANVRRARIVDQQLQVLFAEVGSFYRLRENFHLTPEVKEKFTGKLHGEPRDLLGRKVTGALRTGGLKLLFADGSWVAIGCQSLKPAAKKIWRSWPQPQNNGSSNRATENPGRAPDAARTKRAG